MNRYCFCVTTFFAVALVPPALADDADGVRATIDAYAAALNNEDVLDVLAVYAPDAVFVPNARPTSEGHRAIGEAYSAGFGRFDYDLAFTHIEAHVVGDVAWARTSSAGTLTPWDEPQAVVNASSRELFVMERRADGAWQITRYIFNSAPKPN